MYYFNRKELNFLMKLTKDEELETEWTNKKGLMKRYEHLNVNTLSHWLMEMRRSRDFRKYVINPTPKLVWININGFHEFLKYKQRTNSR